MRKVTLKDLIKYWLYLGYHSCISCLRTIKNKTISLYKIVKTKITNLYKNINKEL